MTCQEAVELMQRDLDHDLSDSERQTMLAHMSRCSECADVYSRLQQLSLDLANIPKVLPPYSLVDSILPRLEEIDRLRIQETTEEHLSAASQRASAVQPLYGRGWLRRLRQSFPLSAIGGVVAAGIILTLFITNQDSVSQKKNADSTLMNHEMAASSANQSDKLKQTTSAGSGSDTKMDVPNAQTMIAPTPDSTVSKEAKDQEIASALPEETPGANQLKSIAPSSAVSTNSASNGTQQVQRNTTQGATESTEDNDVPKDNENPTSTSDFADAGAASNSTADTYGPQAQMEKSDKDRMGFSAGSTDNNKETGTSTEPSPKSADSQMQPSPTPSPNALVPPLSGKLPGSGYESSSIMGMIKADVHRLESPDQLSVAIYNADTKRVTIVKKSDENHILYTSGYQWSDKDHITLNVWKSNSQLSYTFTQGEVRKSYIIDLTTKTETCETSASDVETAK